MFVICVLVWDVCGLVNSYVSSFLVVCWILLVTLICLLIVRFVVCGFLLSCFACVVGLVGGALLCLFGFIFAV